MTDLIDCADPEIREELGEIVVETLDGLVASTVGDSPLPEVWGFEDTLIEAALRIVGEGVDTALTLRVPAPTAIAVTAAIAGEPTAAIELDDARGTVAELCNLLGGTIKTLIDQETALRVPESRLLPTDAAEPIDAVEVHHELGRFDVSLTPRTV